MKTIKIFEKGDWVYCIFSGHSPCIRKVVIEEIHMDPSQCEIAHEAIINLFYLIIEEGSMSLGKGIRVRECYLFETEKEAAQSLLDETRLEINDDEKQLKEAEEREKKLLNLIN